jgi:hypothetical protein
MILLWLTPATLYKTAYQPATDAFLYMISGIKKKAKNHFKCMLYSYFSKPDYITSQMVAW